MTSQVLRSYIGGAYVPGTAAEKKFANLNPATGQVLCEVEIAGAPEVERAIEAARAGFLLWSAMTGAERGRILYKAAQIFTRAQPRIG
ncbi:aldehyde dehydrogenase family protein [Undibacterium arcticum]